MYKMRNRIWYRKVLRQLRHTFDGSKKSTPQNKNNGKEKSDKNCTVEIVASKFP
jgi:hypothetical protein